MIRHFSSINFSLVTKELQAILIISIWANIPDTPEIVLYFWVEVGNPTHSFVFHKMGIIVSNGH